MICLSLIISIDLIDLFGLTVPFLNFEPIIVCRILILHLCIIYRIIGSATRLISQLLSVNLLFYSIISKYWHLVLYLLQPNFLIFMSKPTTDLLSSQR